MAPLEERLRAAIAADGIDLHFQPSVDLPDGHLVGFEALARWTDDELGPMAPDEFIPVAERTGLIVPLGRRVLSRACEAVARWDAAGSTGYAGLVMSVNVSPVQLREPAFTDDVLAALRQHAVAPERLCLEVTETAVVSDVADAAAVLRALRAIGVQIALDDFGTGHSSLRLLRTLPLQTVKIDRSLVSRVAADAQDTVLVQLVVDAAHTLGMRVCAEGVETEDQARQLLALGCDTAQGWLFGRPAAAPSVDQTAAATSWRQLHAPPPVALTGSDDLVLLTDRTRRITYVSGSSTRVLGRGSSELVGRQLSEVLEGAPSDGPVTVQVQHPSGQSRWLRGVVQTLSDEEQQVSTVLCVLSDVTDAVRQEQALADSEELFRSAFEGAPIGIALSDFGGAVVRVNSALADLLGRTEEELLQLSVADFTHPDDLAADDANLSLLRSGGGEQRVLKRYLHADGHVVPVEVYAATALNADGSPSCVVAHVLERRPGVLGPGRGEMSP